MIPLVHQKEGLRGKRKKRREVEQKQGRQDLRRQARMLPQVKLGQGCRMRGTWENMGGNVGF